MVDKHLLSAYIETILPDEVHSVLKDDELLSDYLAEDLCKKFAILTKSDKQKLDEFVIKAENTISSINKSKGSK